jgi:hypothetical protein
MSVPTHPVLSLVAKALTDVAPLDHQLRPELEAAITAALPSATTDQLIAVLTLFEIPDAMEAMRRLTTALFRGAQ